MTRRSLRSQVLEPDPLQVARPPCCADRGPRSTRRESAAAALRPHPPWRVQHTAPRVYAVLEEVLEGRDARPPCSARMRRSLSLGIPGDACIYIYTYIPGRPGPVCSNASWALPLTRMSCSNAVVLCLRWWCSWCMDRVSRVFTAGTANGGCVCACDHRWRKRLARSHDCCTECCSDAEQCRQRRCLGPVPHHPDPT